MKTIVLPGFSPSNKIWAEEIKEKLIEDIEIVYWPHWDSGSPEGSWKEKEAEKIVNKFDGQKINIIAKSVGTIIAMIALSNDFNLVNKLILCGIPISNVEKVGKNIFDVLSSFPAENLLVIQNDKDPLVNYEGVKKMLHEINLKIEVVSRSSSTHDYPYFDDFKNFFN